MAADLKHTIMGIKYLEAPELSLHSVPDGSTSAACHEICHGHGRYSSGLSSAGPRPRYSFASVHVVREVTLTLTLNVFGNHFRRGHDAFGMSLYHPGDRIPFHMMDFHHARHPDTFVWLQDHHDRRSHRHPDLLCYDVLPYPL